MMPRTSKLDADNPDITRVCYTWSATVPPALLLSDEQTMSKSIGVSFDQANVRYTRVMRGSKNAMSRIRDTKHGES